MTVTRVTTTPLAIDEEMVLEEIKQKFGTAGLRRAKRRGVIWLCENAHVDFGHHFADNYLDRCSICDGICEPVPRGSAPEQGASAPLARKAKKKADPPIRVYRGQPFKPEAAVEIVAAETFNPPAPDPPFTIPAEQRRQILAGARPRIVFPRIPPADHPANKPWPAEIGDVLLLTDRVAIGVIGFGETAKEFILHFKVLDARTLYLGRGGDIVDSAAAAVKYKEDPVPGDGSKYSGQFRGDREPEPVEESRSHRRVREEREMKEARDTTKQNRLKFAQEALAYARRRGRSTVEAEKNVRRAKRALGMLVDG
jgi:hypothetical protein